jgi:oligopeptide transport system ATP-binding protein
MHFQSLIKVRNLKKYFYIKKGLRPIQVLRAVDGVNLDVAAGEVLGVVGESGCGKSTLGRAILMLLRPTSGAVFLEGKDLCQLPEQELRKVRGEIQIIFQDPYSSLNPRMTVGEMLKQILRVHGIKGRLEKKMMCYEAMEKVGLEPVHLSRFPHEFSGGQRQRVAIARALILNPKFIVADEPSSALDMSIQAQILNLMKFLQKEMNISYLFVTHNLAAARFMCDHIAVMYLGRIVELGPRDALFQDARHPYTRALLSLCPTLDPDSRMRALILSGEVPSALSPPSGCRFHPRCALRKDHCVDQETELVEISPGHFVACHYA